MSLSVPRALMWVGMIVAGIVLALVLFEGNGNQNYIVYAHVADADDLLPNNFVKIDGIEAGLIKKVFLNKNRSGAIVEFGLEPDAGKIGPGATAAIRPVNLLGEKYLDLSPGNTKDPLPSGSTIPLSRTSDPVELDDVLNTLDPHTLAALQIVVNEAGIAMDGRGADFMTTLHDLPPTLAAARNVVGQVAAQNQALQTAIVDGNQVLTSINSRRNDLQNLVSTGSQALASINTARSNLGATIDDAPAALSQLHTSLDSLQSAAQTLTPAAANLEKATPALASTLERLPAFTSDADTTLQEARSVAPQINRLATQSLPTLKELRPTTRELAGFAGSVKPLLTSLDQQNGLNEVLGFINGWANVTGNGDDLSHVFNLRLSLDADTIKSIIGEYSQLSGLTSLNKKAATNHSAKSSSSTSSSSSPTSSVTGGLASTVGGVTGTLTHTLAGVSKTLSGVASSVGGTVNKVGAGVHNVVSKLGSTLSGQKSQKTTAATPSTTSSSLGSLLTYLLGK